VRAADDSRTRTGIELGERPAHELGTGPARDELPQELDAAVLRVAEQDLVAGVQVEGSHDGVQRRARVRREREVPGGRADVGRELRAGSLEQLREAALEREKVDGLAFELALKALVSLENGPWARPERPVIEEHHGRVEQEQILHSS
jgi:hypothetical protein